VDHSVDAVGEVIPERVRQVELRLAKVTKDILQSAGPDVVPEAVGAAGGADTFQGFIFGVPVGLLVVGRIPGKKGNSETL